MPMREELERQGNWLFRRRGWLPLLGLPVLVLAFRGSSDPVGSYVLDLTWQMVCLVVSLVGLGIRTYTTACTPKHTSGRNTTKGQVADGLNTGGMYSLVRHPLYLGNFLIALGPAMFVRLWWFALLYALVFWLYYERIMFAEEEFLRDKFGDAFVDWASRTPAFLPALRNWRPPDLPFSWRIALQREYYTLFLIVAVFSALEVIADALVARRLVFDPVWTGIFTSAFIFYVVVRVLRKKTKVLSVQGR